MLPGLVAVSEGGVEAPIHAIASIPKRGISWVDIDTVVPLYANTAVYTEYMPGEGACDCDWAEGHSNSVESETSHIDPFGRLQVI